MNSQINAAVIEKYKIGSSIHVADKSQQFSRKFEI